MAHAGLRTLLAVLEALRPALTEPGWRNLVVLFAGWLRTTDMHAVTEALVVTGVAGKRHHEAFHRGDRRHPRAKEGSARLRHWQPSRRGSLTKRQLIFCFGHCWVVLAVLVPVPFSRRAFALPLLLRLYRNKSECEKKHHPYRKKTELARELINTTAGRGPCGSFAG